MIVPKLAVLALGLLAVLPVAPAAHPAVAHYLPAADDSFTYAETIVIDHGAGNYSGYVEHDWINGTETVADAYANGTVLMHYAYAGHWADNVGDSGPIESPSHIGYTFSDRTFAYTNGTDNQTGYSNPTVWFYVDNELAVGGTFNLLNTAFTVTSTDAALATPLTSTGYAATIAGTGTGSFDRDDYYGIFTASYTWHAYFDPSTGYLVGYSYVETDSDGAGDGFTWTDTVGVTHTSYALTPAAAPSSSPGSTPDSWLVAAVVVVVVLVVLGIVVALARRGGSLRGPVLPRHSAGGAVSYAPGPSAGGSAGPPPISLTPSGQPAVQQIVMRETVKVNCRFCGTLIDSTATACPNCGAPRT
ncbi:MAG TPA: zinc ribbon domain-containing protein [Thermoplasmata archaeon]|nr:zinc ribbon domain-containing protein [Thermoplasmata archaeon]